MAVTCPGGTAGGWLGLPGERKRGSSELTSETALDQSLLSKPKLQSPILRCKQGVKFLSYSEI